jgi:heme-degrading monooxygenase HmoA
MAVYTYLWRFRVRPGAEEEFRRHYGPDGTWAALFRRAPGYLHTRLLADLDRPSEFLTVDRWRDEASFLEFRRRFAREFEEQDRRCAPLTEVETELGRFREI